MARSSRPTPPSSSSSSSMTPSARPGPVAAPPTGPVSASVGSSVSSPVAGPVPTPTASPETFAHLFTLPELKGIPDQFFVTEESKKLFELGSDGQGFVLLCWKTEREGKESIAIDLVPSFNYGTPRSKTNKTGAPYYVWYDYDTTRSDLSEEKKVSLAETRQKLIEEGAIFCTSTRELNAIGVVHQEGMEILQATGRVPEDIPSEWVFGAGIFKGISTKLLSDFRINSATFNNKSIIYHPEFITCFYYYPSGELRLNFNQEWWVKRKCPPPIAKKIYQAVTEQLLPEQKIDRTTATCKYDISTFESPEESWWSQNYNNPRAKNEKLVVTSTMQSKKMPTLIF